MTDLASIYLFIFLKPEILINAFLDKPIGTLHGRSIDEVLPLMVDDQNINTIFNFKVTVIQIW